MAEVGPSSTGQRHQRRARPLRVGFYIGASLALALAAYWVYGVATILDPDFNPRGSPEAGLVRAQAIVGAIGIAATLLAAVSALTYASTAFRRWLFSLAVSTLVALPLFGVWYYLALAASSQ